MKLPATLLAAADGLHTEDAKVVDTPAYQVAWDGLLYDADGRTESNLVRTVIERLGQGVALERVARSLAGAYLLIIYDKTEKRSHALVDPNGLYSAYRGSRAVAKSFLDLLTQEEVGRDDLSPEAMLEFLQLGNVYFGDTLTPKIRKIAADEIVTVDPRGVNVEKKEIAWIDDPPLCRDLFDATEPLARAMQGMALSLDLTGGFDSRLLACLMKYHGVPFEAALAGHVGHVDQALGSEVARALGVPFHFTTWDAARIEEDLPDVLLRLDGLSGIISGCHRLGQLNDQRRQRGIEVVFKGAGGELYKDFFWTQDFPFYWSHRSRLGRLHRLRIEFELLSDKLLTEESYQAFLESRQRRLRRLQQYRLSRNTQTYDNIYQRERVQTRNSRFLTSCQRSDLASHSPLCETQAIQVGFRAPRSLRFYNRLHRQYISRVSPAAAHVKTTDGTSASGAWTDLVLDGAGYARVKLRKLLKKVNQGLLNRTRFEPPPITAVDRVVATGLARDALQNLKEQRIVQEHVTYQDIPPRFREYFVVLGWLLSRVTAERGAACYYNGTRGEGRW